MAINGCGCIMLSQVIMQKQQRETYSDIFRMLALGNADHPQEFVDVVTRVTNDTPEDD